MSSGHKVLGVGLGYRGLCWGLTFWALCDRMGLKIKYMIKTKLPPPNIGFSRWLKTYHSKPSCIDEKGKWIKRTPEEARNYTLRKYGLTEDSFEVMVKSQDGACKICRQYVHKKLEVDHDHKTGKVRGLLCEHCNKGLGSFKDNQTSLLRAIQYLKGNLK